MTLTVTDTRDRRGTGGVAAYFTAALAIRISDAGTAAAVVLLVLGTGAVHRGSAGDASLLAACLAVPNVLGPLSARLMTLLPTAKVGLCGSFAVFAAGFLGAGLLIRDGRLAAAAVALLLVGFLGPIVTGGLSSHLGALVAEEQRAQRRAQSADSLTYAISNSVGNSLVGGIAAAVSPLATVCALCALAVAAALLTLRLPIRPQGAAARQSAPMKQVLLAMVRIKPLRDIVTITYGNVIGYYSLVVFSAGFARGKGLSTTVGPMLLSVMGLGALVVGAYFTLRPLARDAVRTAKWCAIVSGLCMTLAGVGDIWSAGAAFLVVGGSQSLLNTAALAVRREASPEDLRSSVFISMAGLKVAIGSIGLGLAGFVPVDDIGYGLAAVGLLSVLAGLAPRAGRR